jgi:hypothetical protein
MGGTNATPRNGGRAAREDEPENSSHRRRAFLTEKLDGKSVREITPLSYTRASLSRFRDRFCFSVLLLSSSG